MMSMVFLKWTDLFLCMTGCLAASNDPCRKTGLNSSLLVSFLIIKVNLSQSFLVVDKNGKLLITADHLVIRQSKQRKSQVISRQYKCL